MPQKQAVCLALHTHTGGMRCDWDQWEVNLEWLLSLQFLPQFKGLAVKDPFPDLYVSRLRHLTLPQNPPDRRHAPRLRVLTNVPT